MSRHWPTFLANPGTYEHSRSSLRAIGQPIYRSSLARGKFPKFAKRKPRGACVLHFPKPLPPVLDVSPALGKPDLGKRRFTDPTRFFFQAIAVLLFEDRPIFSQLWTAFAQKDWAFQVESRAETCRTGVVMTGVKPGGTKLTRVNKGHLLKAGCWGFTTIPSTRKRLSGNRPSFASRN